MITGNSPATFETPDIRQEEESSKNAHKEKCTEETEEKEGNKSKLKCLLYRVKIWKILQQLQVFKLFIDARSKSHHDVVQNYMLKIW